MRKPIFVATATAALMVALVLPAAGIAGKPVEGPGHFAFSDTFPDSICGIDGTSDLTGTENFVAWADGTFQDTLNIHQVFTATGSGKSVEIQVAVHVTGNLNPVENGDATISFTNTFAGLPLKLKLPNGRILTRDAGTVTFTYVWDAVTGDFLYETLSGIHGQFPNLTSGFSVECDALEAALT